VDIAKVGCEDVLLIINGKLPSWMPMVGRYLQAALIG
jgi:hypothetical protein